MKRFLTKVLNITTTLTLSAALVCAADPVLPTAKGATQTKLPETKAAVKTEATKATVTKVTATKAGTAKLADTKAAAKARVGNTPQVDINTATESDLKAIPGIGDAYAAKIIAGRPYAKKDQLKSRKILPEPVYEQVKVAIIAKQPAKTSPLNK